MKREAKRPPRETEGVEETPHDVPGRSPTDARQSSSFWVNFSGSAATSSPAATDQD